MVSAISVARGRGSAPIRNATSDKMGQKAILSLVAFSVFSVLFFSVFLKCFSQFQFLLAVLAYNRN